MRNFHSISIFLQYPQRIPQVPKCVDIGHTKALAEGVLDVKEEWKWKEMRMVQVSMCAETKNVAMRIRVVFEDTNSKCFAALTETGELEPWPFEPYSCTIKSLVRVLNKVL